MLWYMQNGLQLNPDKSETPVIGTSNQLQAASSSLTTISVAGVDLPTAEHMKVLGVTLDRRLSFDQHVSAVARSCNFHAQAIRHIRPLLTRDLAATLTCSLILSRLDYCNAILLHPKASARAEQRGQDRLPGIEKITCQATSEGTALATGRAANRLQGGHADIQGLADINASISQPAHHRPHHHSQSQVIVRSDTGPALLQNDLCQPRFSL